MRFLFRTLVSGVKSISYEIMRGGGSIAAPALAAPAAAAVAGAPAGSAPSVPGTHGLGPVQSFTFVLRARTHVVETRAFFTASADQQRAALMSACVCAPGSPKRSCLRACCVTA